MTVPTRPNLVLIVFDTARRDRFGCYGYGRATTPAVDAFARESLVFDRMIAPAPWTVPSHASLFTGLYPREHGAHNPIPVLPPGTTTLAEWLRAAGYSTVCLTNNPLVHHETGLTQGFDQVILRPGRDRGNRWISAAQFALGLKDSGAWATHLVVAGLLPRLPRPFFLFINFLECHWTYMPPRQFERRFASGLPWSTSVQRRMRQRHQAMWEAISQADDAMLALYNDLYDAELACVDDRFGRLLETLRKSQQDRDSVVILTSDHGENIGDDGLASHQGSLRQNVIHVPFLARIPGKRAQRIEGLTQFTDVFGGICRLLDLPLPGFLEDRPFSLDPFALRPDASGRAFAFAEWHHWGSEKLSSVQRRAPHFDFGRIPLGLRAAQTARFKLVEDMGSGAVRLFDLAADAEERYDIHALRPEEARRLQTALEEWQTSFPTAESAVYSAGDQAAVEHRLRELGYI